MPRPQNFVRLSASFRPGEWRRRFADKTTTRREACPCTPKTGPYLCRQNVDRNSALLAGIMLRHDTVPVVEYQTRTVELPPLLKFTCLTPSGRNVLCLVRDEHRCSVVVGESYAPYFPSGRNALCVVRDAHLCSAVVVKSYMPYSRSGRNVLCLVRDAHRYSAVVIESYAPYSRSDCNALLCSARRAPLQCRH